MVVLMGTNFDWYPPDGSTELHIGKRSAAGGGLCSWSLQAHLTGLDAPLRTWAQWRVLLLLPGSRIVDEYGREHDAVAFIAEVEDTTPANRSRQFDWIVEHDVVDPARDWLCPEGFSFTSCYFG